MTEVLSELWDLPVLVAPMGGGPSTIALVAAAADAGGFAFLAGAYTPPSELAEDIAALRKASTRPFGVNVFVPGTAAADAAAVAAYTRTLEPDAARLGVELGVPRWDDDHWDDKLDVLLDAAPAIVSFTFGCPPGDTVRSLQHRGSLVMVTVTNPAESDAAVDAGADVLCAQGIEAGAHRGTFDDAAPDEELPLRDLLAALRSRTRCPVVAAGGIATPQDTRAALDAGAVAVQAGTAFLRCDESGASPLHKEALVDPRFGATAVTRAFTGRRARGLVNDFMRQHPDAPSAFPEIHHATRPLRTAAARLGDPHALHLWAGVGHQQARAAPVASVLTWIAGAIPDGAP